MTRAMGFQGSREQIDAAWEEVDAEGTGEIDLNALEKALLKYACPRLTQFARTSPLQSCARTNALSLHPSVRGAHSCALLMGGGVWLRPMCVRTVCANAGTWKSTTPSCAVPRSMGSSLPTRAAPSAPSPPDSPPRRLLRSPPHTPRRTLRAERACRRGTPCAMA
jgi:hypothetical protein